MHSVKRRARFVLRVRSCLRSRSVEGMACRPNGPVAFATGAAKLALEPIRVGESATPDRGCLCSQSLAGNCRPKRAPNQEARRTVAEPPATSMA